MKLPLDSIPCFHYQKASEELKNEAKCPVPHGKKEGIVAKVNVQTAKEMRDKLSLSKEELEPYLAKRFEFQSIPIRRV